MSDGLDIVNSMKPSYFHRKKAPAGIISAGFIAHELQPIAPEAVSGTKDAVHPNGKIKPQGVDYGRITPLIVAALKEAITRIEVLEAE